MSHQAIFINSINQTTFNYKERKKSMKNKSLFSIFIFVSIVAFSGLANADWNAQIQVEGQKIKGQYKSSVAIGVGQAEKQTPAPPNAPYYSSSISLISLPAWSPYLVKDIRQNGMTNHMWVIAVNPHGNMAGFEDSTCTVSWDASQLGEGSFKLVSGTDESGEVLISDMKTTTSFDVSGWDRAFYFTIINE